MAEAEGVPQPGAARSGADVIALLGGVHPTAGTFREIVPNERLVFEGDPDASDACAAARRS